MKSIKLFFIFFILIFNIHDGFCGWKYFGQFGHLLIDPEYSPTSKWNHDGQGRSKQNRYSLMWDEEVCRSKGPYDIGYFKNNVMDPANPDGSFTPKIRLRNGFYNPVLYKFLFDWRGACSSWSGSYDDFDVSPDIDKVECRRSGLSDALKVCLTSRVAPYSKRTLYPWLAQIQVGINGKAKTLEKNPSSSDNSKGKYLSDVILRNPDIIEDGFDSLRNIDMDWVTQVNLKNNKDTLKRYTAKFIGQKMACASLIGWDNGDERCSSPQQCLRDESLDLLIKCVLIPLGPPPHPFTDYIVGSNPIYSVYHSGSTYNKPKARIVYFLKEDGSLKKYFTNCEGSGNNGLGDGINSCSGGPGNTYVFDIIVDNKSVCSTLKTISGKVIGYNLGCYPRGGGSASAIPLLDSVTPKSGSDQSVNLSIIYPWKNSTTPVSTIQPIGSAKFLNLSALNEGLDFYNDGKDNQFLTAFQSGFVRNLYNKDFDFTKAVKKKCDLINISAPDNEKLLTKFISIDASCEAQLEMVSNTVINVYSCGVSAPYIYALSATGPGGCTDMGLLATTGIPTQGTKCKNGSLVKFGDRCEDISVSLFYDHDNAGQKICLRNFNGGRDWRSVVREIDGEKRIISFLENDKVLMKLKDDGGIDFDNPDFKTFNQFTADQLDFLRPTSDEEYILKEGDVETKYKYGPKVVPIVTGQDSMGKDIIMETTYKDEKGNPFILSDEEVKRNDIYQGNPDSNGLCVPVKTTVLPTKEWDYVLQMPGYYSNYNIKSDSDVASIKSKFQETPGGSLANSLANDSSKFDNLQSKVLLVPTDYSAGVQTKDAIIGIADDSANRVVSKADLQSKISSSLNIDVSSFNFYSDFFNKILKNDKVMYLDGTDLKDPKKPGVQPTVDEMSKNLFDTSKCDVVDFEIWGGGGSSRAVKQSAGGGTNLFDFTQAADPSLCNINSSGQNGSYAKGRFRIRPNTKLKMLVGSAAGSESDVPSVFDSSSASLKNINILKNSAIWVTDSIDNNVRVVNAESGFDKHECEKLGVSQCKSLEENKLIKDAIDKNVNLVEPDTGDKINLTRYNNIKSLEHLTDPFNKPFDQNNIQIDNYKNTTMSSYCGSTLINSKFDLFATLPLSHPANVNEYRVDNPYDAAINKKGYKINEGIVDLTKSGSGSFSEIGSYYFTNVAALESAFGSKFGFSIDWKGRLNGSSKYGKCEARMRVCYNVGRLADGNFDFGGGRKILVDGNKVVYGGNASGVVGFDGMKFLTDVILSSTLSSDDKKNLVTDMNIYCPGMGGCYFSDDKKGIAQPGTNGLIKVKCFRM